MIQLTLGPLKWCKYDWFMLQDYSIPYFSSPLSKNIICAATGEQALNDTVVAYHSLSIIARGTVILAWAV